jgi:hypothetical protein
MRRLLTLIGLALALAFPALAARPTHRGVVLPATPATVYQVVKDAQPGDTVQLAAGDYRLELWGIQKTGEVVVEPQPGAKVTVIFAGMDGTSYLTLRGLHFVVPAGAQYGVQAWNSVTHVTFDALRIEGSSCADRSTGFGVSFRNLGPNAAVVLKNSDIGCIMSGVGLTDVDGVTLDHNAVHDLQADGFLLSGAHNSVVSNNTGTNWIYPEWVHPDFIQWFNGITPTENLTIKGNRFDRGTGMLVQGIFGEDGQHVYIEDNVLYGTMYNGIANARTHHFKFHHNFVQPLAVEGDLGTWIITRQEADDGDITDNGTPLVTVGANGEAQPTNIRVSGNIVTYPAAPGDTTQYDAWKLATGGGPVPPEPEPCPCSAPLVKRIVNLRQEVRELQRQLDAAQRRADRAVRILQPPAPEQH